MAALENLLKSSVLLDAERLSPVADAAIEMSAMQDSGFWVHWAADFCGRAGAPVSPALTEAGARWEPKTGQVSTGLAGGGEPR
jgi:hypothetical protein